MLKIFPIPALKDNYIWCIVHPNTQQCLIVDPGVAEPVFKVLQEQQLHLAGILVTHHHWDHTGGIIDIINQFEVPVFGSARDNIKACNHPMTTGDIVDILDLKLKVLEIPGHTHGHLAYYNDEFVFTGDTLFTGGCGRVFEGTYEQMLHSLEKLTALPKETLVYCGHEYTESNLRFAQQVEPHNPALLARIASTAELRAKQLPTVPATLELELQTNPFLRTNHPDVINAAQKQAGRTLSNKVEVFTVLREWKNRS